MKEINAFKCDFCGKVYQKKFAVVKHEISCPKNPNNKRACFGCIYLEKKDIIVYNENHGFELPDKLSVLKCMKKSMYVYPPSVEYKKNAIDLDEGNYPMPKDCDDFMTNVEYHFFNRTQND